MKYSFSFKSLVTGAWATNGQYLALGRRDGSVNLWNVAFSRYTIELPVFHGNNMSKVWLSCLNNL